MRKTAKKCVEICTAHGCGTIIIGADKEWKQNCSMGSVGNQRFCCIPHTRFRQMLRTQCEKYGIQYVEQEESCTFKASALGGDPIPTWSAGNNQQYTFFGRRIKRGQHRAKNGHLISADINGALNIGRKRKQNDPGCSGIRLPMGDSGSPARIRIV